MALQFTRHPITCGLFIEAEHVHVNATFTFTYSDRGFVIGAEPYSLVICPHSDLPKRPYRIEGLRTRDESEGGDIEEIWYTGTLQACIREFERITAEIRSAGHQIDEPENYDFQTSVRDYLLNRQIRPVHISYIPSLFDPRYHERGLCEVTLTDIKLNYDADIQFIEGKLHPFGVNVKAGFIRAPVYGKAVGKARSIMHASWVKRGTPGHIPIPKELILVLNSDNQIVDIKCPVCRDKPCECSPETHGQKNE